MPRSADGPMDEAARRSCSAAEVFSGGGRPALCNNSHRPVAESKAQGLQDCRRVFETPKALSLGAVRLPGSGRFLCG